MEEPPASSPERSSLRQALALSEKLKRQLQFEREVGRELEDRNRSLLESLSELRGRHSTLLEAAIAGDSCIGALFLP